MKPTPRLALRPPVLTSLCAALVVAALLSGGPVLAQQEIDAQIGTGVNVQNFAPIAGPRGIFTVEASGVAASLEPSGGLILNFARDPLSLQVAGTNTEIPIVRQQLAMDLLAVIGLFDVAEVGLDLPVVLINNGDLNGQPIQSGVLGDLRLRAKAPVLAPGEVPIGVAVVAVLELPTGDPGAFTSAGVPALLPRLAVDLDLAPVLVAANLGVRIQEERDLGDITVGPGLTYGLGAEVAVVERVVFAGAELFGESTFKDLFGQGVSPLEVLLGAKVRTTRLTFELGGGAGIIGGEGTPTFRVFAGVRYIENDTDLDDDGIPNDIDACPRKAEDFDRYDDSDGCPDPDNDSDGILDLVDGCPSVPEDFDGFDDADGCPDLDNDGDGVVDEVDRCPLEPEDLDRFQDKDGCPDPDNDKDGILDGDDKCPNKPETLNGIEDEDGCPDKDRGKAIVRVEAEEIVIEQEVFFDTDKATIKSESFGLLSAVALTLRGNRQLLRIEIQGHTDDVGSDERNQDLSQRRAESVLEFLVGKGIDPDRLVARGYGESAPAVPIEGLRGGKLKEARTKNRRVQFKILEQKR